MPSEIFHGFQGYELIFAIYLLTAILIMQSAAYLKKFYDEFFIGESPKGWKTISAGMKLLAIFVILDLLLSSIFSEYKAYVSPIRILPALVILAGTIKIINRVSK